MMKDRIDWVGEKGDLMRKQFKQRHLNHETITGKEILDFVDKHACLTGCTVEKVRAFLNHERKKEKGYEPSHKRKKQDGSRPIVKNKVPKPILNAFRLFIDSKTIPSAPECGVVYHKTPSLSRYSPINIESANKARLFS